ncbi:hypothetical protein GJ496_001450 [Pomphorhynchus laevis]|nr:hypothetical protein GJ496_001450 [Pomphorhynchus laevis]
MFKQNTYTLIEIDFKEVFSESWLDQFVNLLSINKKCIEEAVQGKNDLTIVNIIKKNKLSVLVHELIVSEYCRLNYKNIVEDSQSSVPEYLICSYELTVVNILETTFFNKNVVSSLNMNDLIELIDYCYRNISKFIFPTEDVTESDENILMSRQEHCLRLVAITHYMIDTLEDLPLSCANRFTCSHDFLMLIAGVLENKPWMFRQKDNNLKIYLDGYWVKSSSSCSPYQKFEAICWMSIYNLLTLPCLQNKLKVDSYRIQRLTSLQHVTSEDLLTRIIPIKNVLMKMSMNNDINLTGITSNQCGHTTTPCYLIEEVIETLYESLCIAKWNNDCNPKLREINCTSEAFKKLLGILTSNNYADDKSNEYRLHTCCSCANIGIHKCSQCKLAWYCCKDCQIKHWPIHKNDCTIKKQN